MQAITDEIYKNDGLTLLKYGPFYSILATTDHKLAELVFTNKNVRKSPRYRIFKKWLANGLFTDGKHQIIKTFSKHVVLLGNLTHNLL